MTTSTPQTLRLHAQSGASLIIVLLILIVVSILGVGGAQIALMAERGARNDRDMQIAWQAAEAGLIDAEVELTSGAASDARPAMFGLIGVSSPIRYVQGEKVSIANFVDGCGTSTSVNAAAQRTWGLCALPALTASKPAWLTVDFTNTSNTARTVPVGTFTGRSFTTGTTGVRPSKAPRYIVELIPDQGAASRDKTTSDTKYVYRVTAMGFGPRDDIQAVAQMIYRN